MGMTPKHKVYATVLGLGLVALGVDRAFLLGPKKASARELPSERLVATPTALVAAVGVPVSTRTLSNPRMVISARLDAVARSRGFDLGRVPDAFVPSSAWMPVEPVAGGSGPGGPITTIIPIPFKLTAVMAGANGSAIINGEGMVVGDVLDGYKLVAVGSRSAVLERDGHRIDLTLPE